MNPSHPNDPWSVRFYARLVRLYPASHRERFGTGMVQVFRDRLRQCTGPWARMAWRLRAGIDLLRTLPRAYWEERHALRFARPALTAGLATLVLVYAFLVVATSLQPRIYLASARILIRSGPSPIPLLGLPDAAAVDPFRLQSETEFILAIDSLAAVSRDLDLPLRLARQYSSDTPLDPNQVAQILRRHLEVRRFRNTEMVEIRGFFQDDALGAEVVNRVVDEFIRRRSTDDPALRPMVTSLAEPGLRPIAPNVPLNLFLAIPASVGLGLVVALVTWLILRLRRRSALPPTATPA